MVFAHKVVHVTMSGAMLGGAEEWQTGFYVGRPAADADVPNQLFVDAVRDAWQTFFTAPANAISTAYTFTQVKAARLATDGKYDGTDVAISFPTAAVQGPRGGNPMPPQIALVATLVGGSGKGLAGKGRMYLPGINEVVDGSGHINQAFCGTLATNLAAFFNSLNASFDIPGEVINASKGTAKLLGINARNIPVNGVRVGNVYDTQRRRRNALAEVYSTAVVAD